MADRTKASRQHADLALRVGDRVEANLRVDVSNAGLLAIGGMVAAILLSVAVLIGAAARNRPPR